jgi:hypothetical protein
MRILDECCSSMKITSLLLVAMLLTAGTSCTEHKRLAVEKTKAEDATKTARETLVDLDKEYRATSQGLAAIKNDPVMKKGASNLEIQIKSLETSVQELTDKKAQQQRLLEDLKKDLAKYQATNL